MPRLEMLRVRGQGLEETCNDFVRGHHGETSRCAIDNSSVGIKRLAYQPQHAGATIRYSSHYNLGIAIRVSRATASVPRSYVAPDRDAEGSPPPVFVAFSG